ncbi:MAG: hypothetical protein AB7O38_03610 [Pirellulaceae bacterium]
MAKRRSTSSGRINKSQLIREALSQVPHASPTRLSAEFKSQGIDITPNHISMVKSSLMSTDPQAPERSVAGHQTGDELAADDLLAAKHLVDRVGSVAKAEALLGTLKKLQ